MKNKTKEYFEAFNNKDLNELENLYSEGVELRDWMINVKGREEVLSANKTLFAESPDLSIEIINMYEEGGTVICEFVIPLGEVSMKVVDVIEFEDDGKISKIRAYLG